MGLNVLEAQKKFDELHRKHKEELTRELPKSESTEIEI